ncbi:MAG: hypothetical protein EHM24_01050, partial [Acidobacteria bacterium]
MLRRGRTAAAVDSVAKGSAGTLVEASVQVIHYPDSAPPARWHQPVLALGNFDWLHRGHMRIVERVTRTAAERGATPVLLTFDPHP